MKSILYTFAVFLLLLNSGNGNAADNKGFCKTAQTTADLVGCINDHLQSKTSHMEEVFMSVSEASSGDPEFQKIFENNQIDWTNYRDQTCKTEGLAYEGGSLQHVQELHCRARLTGNRIEHLEAISAAFEELDIPEFSNPPRYINSLISDHEDVFWNFGNMATLDTDCDNQDEKIIRGFNDVGQMILAIADSQKTGRPKTTIINFTDKQECRILPEISIVKLPAPKPESEGELAKECAQRIIIKTENCGEFGVKYNIETETYQAEPQSKKKSKIYE